MVGGRGYDARSDIIPTTATHKMLEIWYLRPLPSPQEGGAVLSPSALLQRGRWASPQELTALPLLVTRKRLVLESRGLPEDGGELDKIVAGQLHTSTCRV